MGKKLQCSGKSYKFLSMNSVILHKVLKVLDLTRSKKGETELVRLRKLKVEMMGKLMLDCDDNDVCAAVAVAAVTTTTCK